jgi:bifunctional DNA-binding transcriptional regulator/antitoxin component of YhaV-PrlF toxin-antitoxin module
MEISHVARVSKGYDSVKTTIPQGIAKALHIKPNDILEWYLENDGIRACVEKVKPKKGGK